MNTKSIILSSAGLALGVGAMFFSPAALASSCGSGFQAPTLHGHTAYSFGNPGNTDCGGEYQGDDGHEKDGNPWSGGDGGTHHQDKGPNGGGDWFHGYDGQYGHGQKGDGPICAPVPLPAGVWLLASGAVGLMGFARKRKNASV